MQTPRPRLAALYVAVLMSCLASMSAFPALAVEIEGGEAEFQWEPATGPVSGYQVFVARNGGGFPAEPSMVVGENRVVVRAEPGESVAVYVTAVASDGRTSQESPVSETVRFMAPPPPPTPTEEAPEIQDLPPSTGSGGGAAAPETRFDEESVFDGDPWVFTHAGRFPADLDGDGTEELVWHEAGSGHTEIWFGLSAVSVERRRAALPDGFEILAVDQFSGDGTAEALGRSRDTGAMLSWDGTAFTAATALPKPRGRWHVVSSHDVDDDGDSDPVFVGPRSRRALAWKTDASGLTGTGRVKLPKTEGLAEYDLDVTDLDGDGMADAVLYDPTTGEASAWFGVMKRRPTSENIPEIGPGGMLLSSRDLDGNGEAEVLFQLADGTLRIWNPESGVSRELGLAPIGFAFAAIGEFDGLGGGLEILWMDAAGDGLLWHLGAAGVESESVLGN